MNVNIPKRRFKGFSEDWEQEKLKNISTVSSCKRIYKNETHELGEIPFYKIGTIGKKPDSYITREIFENYKQNYDYPDYGDTIITASGSIGRLFQYQGEEAYFQDSNLVWLNFKLEMNKDYTYYYLNRIRWAVEGTTITRLYNKNILSSIFKYPNLEEQKKIAKLLNTIDKTISLHKRKLKIIDETIHELRKQLFSTKYIAGKKVKSKKMKLNDFLEEVIEHSNKENQYPLLSSTNNGIETRSGRVSGSSNIGYKILRENQLVLSPQNLWLGNININRDFEVGIVSPSYKVFDIKNIKIIYLENILKTERMKYNFDKISIQGASVVRRNLDMKEFLNLEVRVTQKNEQEKLVKTFVQLSNIKFSLRSKIKILEKLKILYLDKMFI